MTVLQQVLDSVGIERSRYPQLLGVDHHLFAEWISGQRTVPESYLELLATTLGIASEALQRPTGPRTPQEGDLTPAVWFKFRGPKLMEADREYVFLVRQLGYYLSELDAITESRSTGWSTLFEEIRRDIDPQAPPKEQGRAAAKILRASRGLGHGESGIGEVLRPNLRQMGLLLIEQPVPESKIEGCCFYVGPKAGTRPCIFANTHHSTWFRRNAVILHEVAHAIFDAKEGGATLDFKDDAHDNPVAEFRAQAFAQEVLVPASALKHNAQGLRWNRMSPDDLASLVARLHAEKRLILDAAKDAGWLDTEKASEYEALDISQGLCQFSLHALSTEAFIQQTGEACAAQWIGKRATTLTSRPLRLPIGYVDRVVWAAREGLISLSKAARMLMIDERTFANRFPDLIQQTDW